MDSGGLLCSGCGSSNVTFIPQLRKLVCNQCGKETFYERATLNANGKVVLSRQNMIQFFLNGKYEDARHFSREVLNIAMDNVPALFVMAFCDEFVDKHNERIHDFFVQVNNVSLEYDEVREMIKLIKASAYRLVEYEGQVIELLAKNMQSEESLPELTDVLDTVCPYFISKRTSMDYLTASLVDMYKELAMHCGIPKTCFALLKSIETNPDSPYASNSFFLTSKCRFFYEHYIIPIGDIISAMGNSEYSAKFMNAYNSKCQKYKVDANL